MSVRTVIICFSNGNYNSTRVSADGRLQTIRYDLESTALIRHEKQLTNEPRIMFNSLSFDLHRRTLDMKTRKLKQQLKCCNYCFLLVHLSTAFCFELWARPGQTDLQTNGRANRPGQTARKTLNAAYKNGLLINRFLISLSSYSVESCYYMCIFLLLLLEQNVSFTGYCI